MRIWRIAACCVLVLVLSVPAPAAARSRHGTRVVCVGAETGHRVYRKKPGHCTYHRHGEPMAEAFFVRTVHDHWHRWRRGRALGRGRDRAPIGHSTQRVRIRLSHPVHRCGHRVFSRARFYFPKVGRGSTMRLDTCAGA